MIPFSVIVQNLNYRCVVSSKNFNPEKFKGTLKWIWLQAGMECKFVTHFDVNNNFLFFCDNEAIAKRFSFQYKTEYEKLNLKKIYRDDWEFKVKKFNHYIWAKDDDVFTVSVKNQRLLWMMKVLGKFGEDFDVFNQLFKSDNYIIYGFREQKTAFTFKMAYERCSSYIEIMDRF